MTMTYGIVRALLLLPLLACSSGSTDFALQVQGAGGQLAYGAPTLAAAKRAFFGAGSGDGGDGSGGGGNDVLGTQDTVHLNGLPPTVTALTVSRSQPFGQGIVLTTSAHVGYQHLHGSLPDGFGVLTDPLDIEIWAQSLGAQMTLGQTAPLPHGLHLTYGAGLGVTRLQAATHLQSALLNVRGRSLQILPYALAEMRVAGQSGPALLGSLYIFDEATELRLGVEQSF